MNRPPPTEAGWSVVVDPGSDGLRLDIFLSLRIPRLSRTRAARLDVVDLDAPGRPLKKSQAVRSGQRLWARRPVPDADANPPVPTELYRDRDLIVLDKPAGLAVHPTASRFKATVTHFLAASMAGAEPGVPLPEPAHRLDVETSGVLICSRHRLADRRLKAAFADQRVHKTYRAVVEGHPPDAWTVDQPLGFDPGSAVRLKMGPGDKPARTALRTVRRGQRRGQPRALVEAQPITGRQHQIRVHLALSGHPIVGDKLYGPDEKLFLAHLDRPLTAAEINRLGAARHALHAWRLELQLDREPRRFVAPWPAELDRLLHD